MNFSSRSTAQPAALILLATLLLATTVLDSTHHRFTIYCGSISLGVFACAFLWRRRTLGTEDEAAESPLLLPAALIGVVAMELTIRKFSGVPEFSHDWKWPLVRAAFITWPVSLTSLWNDWGSGGPAVQALANYPITLMGAAFGAVASPLLALRLTIGIIGAIAGIGAALLASRLRLGTVFGLIAAAVFPLLPPTFNRLNAGHLLWLLSFATFPWLLAAFDEPVARRRIAASGLLLGIVALQTQCVLFCGLALAMFARRKAFSFVAIVATGVALCAPVFASIYAAHFQAAYASAHATVFWQAAQSAPVLISLVGAADPIHYFERAGIPVLAMLPAVALAGFGAISSRRGVALGFCWIAAAAWSAGAFGPFATFLNVFTLSSIGTAFREYSHAEIVAAPAFLLLVLLGANALLVRSRLAAVLAVAVLVPLLSPAAQGVANLASGRDAGNLERMAQMVAGLPGNGEVLWWPGVQPVSYANARGGVDSDAFAIGKHVPYTDYRPTPQVVVMLAELQKGDRSACSLLANLGVQAVVVRKGILLASSLGLQQTAPSEGTLRSAGLVEIAATPDAVLYSVPCYRGRLTFAKTSVQLRGDWHDLARLDSGGLRDVRTSPPALRNCITTAPRFDFSTPDESRAVVPLSALDARFAKFGWAFGDPGITRNHSLINGNYILASREGAPYRWQPNNRAAANDEIGIWLTAACSFGLYESTNSVAALARVNTTAQQLQRGGLSVNRGILRGGGLVVFHQSSFGNWQARTDRGLLPEAVQANGFAAGWQIPEGTTNFDLTYNAPDVRWFWLVVMFTAALNIAILSSRTNRKRQE